MSRPLLLSAGGAKHFVTFLDDYTEGSDVYFLKSKDETFPAFKNFKIQSERGTYIIWLRTDYGGEYEDHDSRDFHFDPSIQWEPTVPGTPQQNGAAERLGQALMRKASTMLRGAGLFSRHWDEMVHTANYLRNRSPVTSKSITPYEAQGAKPNYTHLRIIGTTGYAANRVPPTGAMKLKERRTLCVLVGYEGNHVYRMLHPNGNIICASNVDWNRENCPSLETASDQGSSLKRKTKEEISLEKRLRMSDPGKANKIDQPLEATIDDAEPILPDPIHTNSPKPAPQDEDKENPTLPTPYPPVSRETSSTLRDLPPIHEIRRSTRIRQTMSPAYLTKSNPHFPC